MNVLPPSQQQRLLLGNDPQSTADLAAGHAVGPDQFRRATGTEQVDLGLTVAEDMDVSRPMVVDEDDHAQAMSTKHSDNTSV